MAKKSAAAKVGQASSLSPKSQKKETGKMPVPRPSSLLDTRVIYCGDNLEQLAKLPDACVDLIYIDPPFNSNVSVTRGTTIQKSERCHSVRL
jgi:16S rRNA G966 N2-methylase RsmD